MPDLEDILRSGNITDIKKGGITTGKEVVVVDDVNSQLQDYLLVNGSKSMATGYVPGVAYDVVTKQYVDNQVVDHRNLHGLDAADQHAMGVVTGLHSALGTKVDKVAGKDLSDNNFTTPEKTNLANQSGSNTGDQQSSDFDHDSLANFQQTEHFVQADISILGDQVSNLGDVVDTHIAATDHNSLANKDADNAHPQSAITGLVSDLGDKVDEVTGKGLSTEDYTTGEKAKLAGLQESTYKGHFTDAAALETAYPAVSQDVGDNADVTDAATIHRYVIVDTPPHTWTDQGVIGADNPAEIKSKYEFNADTNAFTDDAESKVLDLSGVNTGDQQSSDFDHNQLANYEVNEHFTQAAISIPVSQVSGVDGVVDSRISVTPHNNLAGRNVAACHNVDNIAGLIAALGTKVDKVAGKALSTEDYTTAEKIKVANITGVNSGDQVAGDFKHDELDEVNVHQHFTQSQISIPTTQIDGFDTSVRTAIENTDHNNLSGRQNVPDGIIDAHDIGAITGLQPALDAKAPLSAVQASAGWIYTSDYLTLQAAIDYAEAQFPQKNVMVNGVNGDTANPTITIDQPLEIRKGRYTISGDRHPHWRRIWCSNPYSHGEVIRINYQASNYLEDLRIENLGVRGIFNSGIACILASNLVRCRFNNLRLYEAGFGIQLRKTHATLGTGNFGVRISDCYIYDMLYYHVYSDWLSHVTHISNNAFYNYGTMYPKGMVGLSLATTSVDRGYSSGVVVRDNWMETQHLQPDGAFIEIAEGRGLIISGNYMESHGGDTYCIRLGSSPGATTYPVRGASIMGNHMQGANSGRKAIAINHGRGVSITGNNCSGYGGLYWNDGNTTNLSVLGNNINT